MKTICIVVYRLGVGGAEQMVVGEINEFLRRGYAVHLVTLFPEGNDSLMHLVQPGCQKHLVRFEHPLHIGSIVALADIFRTMQPDIIVSQLWFANTVVRLAALKARMTNRVLSFEQNVYDRVKSIRQYLIDYLLQYCCRSVIAISQSVKRSLIRHGIHERRITIIYNAIDLTRSSAAKPADLRAELSIDNSAFIYLFVGRLVPQKGVDILLSAFAKQKEGSVLVLAGNGDDRAKLQAQAQTLSIASRVFFLGIRDDVLSLMKAADCFVLASRWEGFGIVLAEALACGAPIVASKVDGIAEVVDDESGILVPPEEVEALSRALSQMRSNAAERSAMARHALERARRFSVEYHVDAILACFSIVEKTV